MSADLFAAFGSPELSDNGAKRESTSKVTHISGVRSVEDTWQPWPTTTEHNQTRGQQKNINLWKEDGHGKGVIFDAEDLESQQSPCQEIEDDFGDFEDAEADTSTNVQFSDSPPNATKTIGTLLDFEEDGSESMNLTDQPRPTSMPTLKNEPVTGFALHSTRNVEPLALTTVEDDDWGNFEDGGHAPTISAMNATAGASPGLPIDHVTISLSQPATIVEPPRQVAEGSKTISQKSPATDDEFDAWDEFEDGVPAVQPTAESGTRIGKQNRFAQMAEKPPVRRERPINVPPPAVLLSLCTKVWPLLAARAGLSQNIEDVGVAALRTYRVSARIISGRAQRWKRDTNLAQSMRIGAAGRSGGMKLAALDKSESRKEDQEAEEAITSWTRASHIMGAAMIKAKIQKPTISLSTKLGVRIATGPDVLNANHVCPICGLKRNERINGVDVDVSDTFGDFWIEHWGHSDCCLWWEQYNQLLEQR